MTHVGKVSSVMLGKSNRTGFSHAWVQVILLQIITYLPLNFLLWVCMKDQAILEICDFFPSAILFKRCDFMSFYIVYI